ncbi:hypothetical protein [Nocardioides pakistanensis]
MTETTSSTTSGGFTDAVRAVLVEMDIDDLPKPMRISPAGANGVELQVAGHEFPAWVGVLSNIHVTTPARGHSFQGGPKQDHIHAAGTINGFDVRIVTVVPADTNPLHTSTAEEYRCTKCGAQFGIAGTHTGSPEDDAADEHFRDEVERHESGACQSKAVAS